MNGLGIFALLIFCVTLFGTYITIRRQRLSTATAGALCGAITISAVTVYSLTADLSFLFALIVGIAIGTIFTGAVVAMAAFFQANQPHALKEALNKEHSSQDQ